jgi:hypothetical protein
LLSEAQQLYQSAPQQYGRGEMIVVAAPRAGDQPAGGTPAGAASASPLAAPSLAIPFGGSALAAPPTVAPPTIAPTSGSDDNEGGDSSFTAKP